MTAVRSKPTGDAVSSARVRSVRGRCSCASSGTKSASAVASCESAPTRTPRQWLVVRHENASRHGERALLPRALSATRAASGQFSSGGPDAAAMKAVWSASRALREGATGDALNLAANRVHHIYD